MFQDSLLESSNLARKSKDKRWPMALAFALEMMAVSFLLLVPLMSTGVIPVLAHVPRIAPIQSVEVADQTPSHTSGSKGANAGPSQIIRAFNHANALKIGDPQPIGEPSVSPFEHFTGERTGPEIGNLMCAHDCVAIARPAEPVKRLRFSHLSEGLLVRKVDPVYPRTAMITRTFGAVQLHAIIARDGTIQSLNVISGNPILAQAALDAVRQWRYKPYMLNDQAVEVETFITVNFRSATN